MNDKYPYSESIRDNYLPIHPKPPVVSGGFQLRLGDLRLRKPSYVEIKAQYIVHIDVLERYDRKYAASRFYLDPDVLQVFTVPNHGKLRGCEKPISLIKAKTASVFSMRRNTIEIAPLLADVS